MIENENVSHEKTTQVTEQSVEQTETNEANAEFVKETIELVQPLVSSKADESKLEDANHAPELTQDVLNKAISIAKNSGKEWEEITQEERWDYIKQARN